MANIKLTPSGTGSDSSYASVPSNYPLTNLVGKDSSTSNNYAGFNLNTGTNAASYVYIDFDASSIPKNVSITSITSNIKTYGTTNAQNRTSTRQVQLYSGTTAKGSATSFSLNSTQTASITNGGSWTRDELDNLRIRVYVTRSSTNNTTSQAVYIMGADVTVEYETAVNHSITIQTSDGITTNKEAVNNISEGSNFSINIFGNVGSITDNGVNVLSNLLEKTASSGNQSVTSSPTTYTTSGSIRGTNYQNAVGKGSDATATGNDYCQTSGSTATITYSFDFSSIPEDAIIESVEVKAGGHCESASNSNGKADLQLYSGSTEKGSKSSFTSTSKQVITMTPGTWTREELQNAKLQFTIGYYGGLVNGVDFIVNYSLPSTGEVYHVYTISNVAENHTIIISADAGGTNLYIKVDSNTVKNVKRVLMKTSTGWEEYTDLQSYFTIGKHFQRGE